MEGSMERNNGDAVSSAEGPAAAAMLTTWRRSSACVSMINDGVGRSLNRISEDLHGIVVDAAMRMPTVMG